MSSIGKFTKLAKKGYLLDQDRVPLVVKNNGFAKNVLASRMFIWESNKWKEIFVGFNAEILLTRRWKILVKRRFKGHNEYDSKTWSYNWDSK